MTSPLTDWERWQAEARDELDNLSRGGLSEACLADSITALRKLVAAPPALTWSDEPPTEPCDLALARDGDNGKAWLIEIERSYHDALIVVRHNGEGKTFRTALERFSVEDSWQWCVLTIADPTPQEPSE